MIDTFLKILPFSLGGAVNPFGILLIFFLLAAARKPLQKAWLFLAGSVSFLIAVIFIENLLLQHTIGHTRHHTAVSADLDIALGITLILLVIFRKSAHKDESGKDRSRLGNFLFGFMFMITDLSTLVLYFSALKIVFEAHLSIPDDMILLAVNILITMSTMALPVLVATVMPAKSALILDPIKRFIGKHGNQVSKGVIFLIALYLIYRGVGFFI